MNDKSHAESLILSAEIKVDKDVFLSASKLHIGRWFTFWAAFSILISIPVIFLVNEFKKDTAFIVLISSVLFGSIYFALSRNPWLVSHRQIKLAEQTHTLPSVWECRISEEFFFQRFMTSESRLDWNSFYKWSQNDEVILIYQNAGRYIVVSTKGLTADFLTMLRHQLQDHLGEPGKKGFFW